MDNADISIVNNFPISSNQKNEIYFQQNNFWFLVLNYIFNQSQNITMYTLISLLEQYFIWCKDVNLHNFLQIKELMKEYISKHFTQENLNQFLFINKLKAIDDIFTKFESTLKNDHLIPLNYQEIKIDNFNLNKSGNIKCKCDLCKSDEACLKKVADINKEKIKIIKGQNFDFQGNKNIKKTAINNMDISTGEELYFKGISNKKNQNLIFTESKTRLSENTNFDPSPSVDETSIVSL